MRLERAAAGPAQLHHVTFAMDFAADASPLGALVFGQLNSGLVSNGSSGSERRLRPGDVFLTAQPDAPYTATTQDTEVELAIIDPALPSQVADTGPGRRFTGYEPGSPPAAQLWVRLDDSP